MTPLPGAVNTQVAAAAQRDCANKYLSHSRSTARSGFLVRKT